MQKIVSLFQRNYDGDHLVRPEVVPGSEWVLAGEGTPTRKLDGSCCMVRDGKLYKRCEIKKGGRSPAGFEPAADQDPVTGKQQGWLPVGDGAEDKWHRAAWEACEKRGLPDGTYELVGPNVQGNPEQLDQHQLVPHGCEALPDCPFPQWFEGECQAEGFFAEVKAYLAAHDIEGIVWHHPDGRLVKIKGRDFGLKRPKGA